MSHQDWRRRYGSVCTAYFLACITVTVAHADTSPFLGSWEMETDFNSQQITAVMTLTEQDGKLAGTWESQGRSMDLSELSITGNTLRFVRAIPGGPRLQFVGTLDNGKIQGSYDGEFGNLACRGTRARPKQQTPETPTPEAPIHEAPTQQPKRKLHDRPMLEKDGKVLVWAREDQRTGATEYFDMTGALIDPRELQFGIGKDTIASIDQPEFLAIDHPRLLAANVNDATPVLGVVIDGVSKAYPLSVMRRHEVINDYFGKTPYAVLW